MLYDLRNIDCELLLKELPDSSIDLLLQDTPFGVTQNKWDIKPNLPVMWKHWERVTKENGAMIFFATQPFASELILSNTKNFRYDLVWYKPLGSGFLNAKRMPLRNHESILVFYRKLPTYNPQMGVGKRKKGRDTRIDNGTNYGKFTKTKLTYDDEGKRFPQSVIEFTNGDRTHEQGHPTQKPLELMRYLVATFSNVNDTVFDGYSGSGTTAEACVSLKRNFIGAELDEKYYIDAKQRIENAQLQTSLF